MPLLISPVRKVVLTCRVIFWKRNVKLHLTPRSIGQIRKNMLILGENGVTTKSWSVLVPMLIFGCQRYLPIKKVNGLDPVRPSRKELSEVKICLY